MKVLKSSRFWMLILAGGLSMILWMLLANFPPIVPTVPTYPHLKGEMYLYHDVINGYDEHLLQSFNTFDSELQIQIFYEQMLMSEGWLKEYQEPYQSGIIEIRLDFKREYHPWFQYTQTKELRIYIKDQGTYREVRIYQKVPVIIDDTGAL